MAVAACTANIRWQRFWRMGPIAARVQSTTSRARAHLSATRASYSLALTTKVHIGMSLTTSLIHRGASNCTRVHRHLTRRCGSL